MSWDTSPVINRAMCVLLFDSEQGTTPGGIDAFKWFASMDERLAFAHYYQIRQLPEGFRERDLMERMEEAESA